MIYLDAARAGVPWLFDPASEELGALAREADARTGETPCDAAALAADAPLLRTLMRERHFGVANGVVPFPSEVLDAWEDLLARGPATWGEAVTVLQSDLQAALVDSHLRLRGAPYDDDPGGAAVEELELDGVLVVKVRRLIGDVADERALVAWADSADRHFAHERIVVDLRGNRGGNDGHTYRWAERRLRATSGFGGDVTWMVGGRPLGNWNQSAWREARDGADAVPQSLRAGRHEPRPDDELETVEERYELEAGDRPWAGRMLVLTDRATRSSGESSTWLLARGLGATVAGEPTMGMIEYGNIVPYALPRSGLVINLPTKRNDFGFPVERIGLPVDVPLDPGTPVEEIVARFDGFVRR